MNDHPTIGLTDVFAAMLPSLRFAPGIHINYAETVLRKMACLSSVSGCSYPRSLVPDDHIDGKLAVAQARINVGLIARRRAARMPRRSATAAASRVAPRVTTTRSQS